MPDLAALDERPAPGSSDEEVIGSAAGTAQRPSIWPAVERRLLELVREHRSTIVFANSRRLAERLTSRLNELAAEELRQAQELDAAGRRRSSPRSRPRRSAQSGIGGGAAADRGEGAPRVDVPRAAHPGRGGAQGRPAALRRGHVQPGAGHRHGRGRPRGAGRGAAERGVRAAAGRPGRAPGRRGVHAAWCSPSTGATWCPARWSPSGWPAGRSSRCATRATRSTCSPSRSSRWSRWSRGRSPTSPGSCAGPRRSPRCPTRRCTRCWTCWPGATRPRSSASCGPGSPGTGSPTSCTAGPARSGSPSPPAARSPTAGLFTVMTPGGADGARLAGRRAGRGDGLRVAGRRHVPARHVELAGGGHHARPRDRHPGAGTAGPDAVLEGRVDRAPAGAGPRGRRLRARDVRRWPTRRRGSGPPPPGWTQWAADNLLAYLHEQRDATRHVPSDRTILVERFRDELGDWRLVVHSPFGSQVNGPWGLAIAARMRERRGVEVHAAAADDGIVLRLPDAVDDSGAEVVPTAEDVLLDPAEVEQIVVAELGSSSLYASRFRECAARALLLPRRDPKRRSPLWQQRQRSAQLLAVAGAVRAVPDHARGDARVRAGRLRPARAARADVRRRRAEGARGGGGDARAVAVRAQPAVRLRRDVPLRDRRAAGRAAGRGAVAGLHAARRAARLRGDPGAARPRGAGRGRGVAAAAGPRAARPRRRGRGRPAALPRRPHHRGGRRARGAPGVARRRWRRRGGRSGCGSPARSAGSRSRTPAGCATRSGPRCRSGCPRRSPSRCPTRWATWCCATPAPTARSRPRSARPGSGSGSPSSPGCSTGWSGPAGWSAGELRPLPAPSRAATAADGLEYCDAEVLRRLRRASLARLRAEVEPVEQRALGRFLPAWQGVQTGGRRRPAGPDAPGARRGGRARGRGAARRGAAAGQRAGVAGPARPAARVHPGAARRAHRGRRGHLDRLRCARRQRRLARGGPDRRRRPAAARARARRRRHPAAPGAARRAGPARLEPPVGGGALFFRELADRAGRALLDAGEPAAGDDAVVAAIWDLVWAGLLTNDTLAPLRARLGGGARPAGGGAHRPRRSAPRGRYAQLRAGRPALPSRGGPPSVGGRWALAVGREPDPTRRAHARAEAFLERHGVLTRGALGTERVSGGFAAVYRVLRAMEDSGRARRGYVVEGLGAAQFAVPGAIDRLRALSRPDGGPPGGGRRRDRPAGAGARPMAPPRSPGWCWPRPTPPSPTAPRWPGPRRSATPSTGRAARRARWWCWSRAGPRCMWSGAGRSLLSFTTDRGELQAAAQALAGAVHEGWLGTLGRRAGRRRRLAGLGAGRGAHRGRVPGHPQGAATTGMNRLRA